MASTKQHCYSSLACVHVHVHVYTTHCTIPTVCLLMLFFFISIEIIPSGQRHQHLKALRLVVFAFGL